MLALLQALFFYAYMFAKHRFWSFLCEICQIREYDLLAISLLNYLSGLVSPFCNIGNLASLPKDSETSMSFRASNFDQLLVNACYLLSVSALWMINIGLEFYVMVKHRLRV